MENKKCEKCGKYSVSLHQGVCFDCREKATGANGNEVIEISDTMNRQLGTKWFTFYTKVRPWIACLMVLPVISDFMQHQEVYASYWWLMVYFFAALAQPVLCVCVFVKSQGDYEGFVHFVKGVLVFETINMAYGQAVQQYINSKFNIDVTFVVGIVILLLGYFIWYRLNMKYFKKRISVTTNDYFPEDADRIRFCRKCGEKLIDGSKFCRVCDTEVIEEPNAFAYSQDDCEFCKKCGADITNDIDICHVCGEPKIK